LEHFALARRQLLTGFLGRNDRWQADRLAGEFRVDGDQPICHRSHESGQSLATRIAREIAPRSPAERGDEPALVSDRAEDDNRLCWGKGSRLLDVSDAVWVKQEEVAGGEQRATRQGVKVRLMADDLDPFLGEECGEPSAHGGPGRDDDDARHLGRHRRDDDVTHLATAQDPEPDRVVRPA
jgi:hypothetical protein